MESSLCLRLGQAPKQSIPRAKKTSTPFDNIPVRLRQTYADRIYCCFTFPEEGAFGSSYQYIQWDEIANCLNQAFSRQDNVHNPREIWEDVTGDNSLDDEGLRAKNHYLRIGGTKIATYHENLIDGETVLEILKYMQISSSARRHGNPWPNVPGYDSETVDDWIEAWCHPETTESARRCIKDRSLGWGEFDISAAERQRRYFPPPFPDFKQSSLDWLDEIASRKALLTVPEEEEPKPPFDRDPEKMLWE